MSALDAWLAHQETVHVRSVDLGLERIATVARTLGLGKPAPTVLSVAGTNGKGSTVAFLEQLLLVAGRTVGTFTSPHLLRYNERIHVNGQEAGDAELVAAFETIDRARGAITLTFFEFNALAAFLLMKDARVDVAVLEVGLGGRLDAVNLIDADATIVCSIGLDHRDWLGDTLEKIGSEKAGILRRGACTVLATAEMPQSIYAAACESQAHLLIAGRDYFWAEDRECWTYRGTQRALASLPRPALEGTIQLRNAAAALAALEALGLSARLGPEQISAALSATRLPGRFERMVDKAGVEWIFDVAHNPPAAHGLAAYLKSLRATRTIAVAGILADKDALAIASALSGAIDQWILCTLEGARGLSASGLAALTGAVIHSPQLAESVAEGCRIARTEARAGERVVVFGSFHTVGPALQFVRLY